MVPAIAMEGLERSMDSILPHFWFLEGERMSPKAEEKWIHSLV